MKRNFTNENFEEFLRQNADAFKMRPKAQVWKGISSSIKRPKRVILFSLISMFILSGSVCYTLLTAHRPEIYQQAKLHPAALGNSLSNQIAKQPQPASTAASKDLALLSKRAAQKLFAPFSLISNAGNFRVPIQSSATQAIPPKNNSANSLAYTPRVNDDNDVLASPTSEENFLEKKKSELTYPLGIESVVNTFQKTKRSKTSIEFYLTPTVSYRKLQEHRNIIRSTTPVGVASYQSTSMYNINNAVTQKPDMGIEFGVGLKHIIARNLKLRAGLQFNINRYDVKVFNTPYQLSTIQLNNNSNPDYLNTITNYGNFNGFQSNWLQNFYFQVSAPVGLEFKVKGDENIQFGLASTIQPTYILGERAYLISSDYKTYAQVPGLLRHTNVNTSLETFVSYATHKYRWQVGPEVRYQLFSSFVQNYSIKEHLIDFGLKIGISPLK